MASKEIAKAQETALSRPSFVQGGAMGTEHLTKEDIAMPRLALAQQMSKELVETDPKYIDGLKAGHFFNSVTKEILGKGPIKFTVIRADRPRFIHFRPIDEGGGIIEMDVDPNDPRCKFGANGEAPVATKFYDFIVALLPLTEGNPLERVLALSLKSTGIKAAKQLNSLLKFRNAPVFAGAYELNSGSETNPKGTYYVNIIKNAAWVTEPEYALGKQLFESLKDKEINIDREHAGEEEFVEPGASDASNM